MILFSKKFRAFSIIEISIVLIVIGILVSGISTGMDLYNDFKISTARNLTINSRVNRVSDLDLWLETVGNEAFSYLNTSATPNKYEIVKNIQDSHPVHKWNNLKYTEKKEYGDDVLQSNETKRPIFKSSAINGLPALYFDGKTDGTGDFFSFNGKFLDKKINITIFIVDKRTALGTASTSPAYATPYQYILSGDDSVNFSVGYSGSWLRMNPSNINWMGFSNKLDEPHIFTFQADENDGAKIFMDGVLKISQSTSSTISIGNGTLNIAYFNRSWTQNWYTGFIGEIIIFNKSLNDSERRGVEEYLSQKWKIRLGK